MFPRAATFEGYNFDILIGLSAPLIAYMDFRRGKMNKPLLVFWNIAGFITLIIVVLILLTYAYFPKAWGEPESILVKGGFSFPFTFLAGFLMPLAVFLHIYSLMKTQNSLR
jgi:hypothetical protein